MPSVVLEASGEPQRRQTEMAYAAYIYIIFWISISCTMILFNKAVLDYMKFPYPMFLTTWHMTLATILTQIMSRTTKMLPGVQEVLPTRHDIEISHFFHGWLTYHYPPPTHPTRPTRKRWMRR